MAPSPWPDYQCTEPKAPDKKSDVYSSRSDEAAKTSADMKESRGDNNGNEVSQTVLLELQSIPLYLSYLLCLLYFILFLSYPGLPLSLNCCQPYVCNWVCVSFPFVPASTVKSL